MSLSIAQVPMCVAVMYRMFEKSNASSAPTSDFSSSALSLASRSLLRRSKSTRASQSTPFMPVVPVFFMISAFVLEVGMSMRRMREARTHCC